MGVFEQFPYVNMHEMNLQWLLEQMKELVKAMETFKATESLKFADPIIWDITTQYEKSTIVLDPTGNAYMSIQAVPAGVQLNNEEYWLEIFNFTEYTRTANQNLTVNTETNTTRASAAYQIDDWLIWNDVLYRVTAAIAIDDALVIGTNLVHFTVEDFIKAFIAYATNLINQYKNDIDASELAYRQRLAQDIANTTASLQAQLNAAIAGATVDSEVINARIGADGVTYSTLGEAIRTQITNLMGAYYTEAVDNDANRSLLELKTIGADGSITIDNTRASTTGLFLTAPVKISYSNGYQVRRIVRYNLDGTFADTIADITGYWTTVGTSREMTLTDTTYFYRLVFNKNTDTQTISADEAAGIIIKLYTPKEITIDEIYNNMDKNNLVLIYGSVAAANGLIDYRVYDKRVMTKGLIKAPFSIKCLSGFQIRTVFKYLPVGDGTFTYDASTSVKYTSFSAIDGYYKVVFNKTDDTQVINTNELNAVAELVDSTELDFGAVNSDGSLNNTAPYTTTRARTIGFTKGPFIVKCNGDYNIRAAYRYVLSEGSLTFDSVITNVTGFFKADDNAYYKFVCNQRVDDTQAVVLNDIGFTIYKGNALKTPINTSADKLFKIAKSNTKLSAHFGGNLLAEYLNFTFPEYSHFNLMLAKRAGFTMVGLNLAITSDRVVVCSHDLTIDRTMRARADYDTPITGNIAISSLTYSDLKSNYVMISSIARLREPILSFEDAVKTCKNLNLGIIILPANDSSGNAAIEILKKYGIDDFGVVYHKRLDPDALQIVYTNRAINLSEMLEKLHIVGAPACLMFDNIVESYSLSALKTYLGRLHQNGFIASASLHGSKSQFITMQRAGSFDYSNTDNDIPEFVDGDISIVPTTDFSNYTCTGVNAVNGGLVSGDSIAFSDNTYDFAGACIHIQFQGDIKITFGTGYNALELSSDGSEMLYITNVFYNSPVAFNITTDSAAGIRALSIDIKSIT